MTKEDLLQFPNAKWALPFFASHKDFCFRFVDLLKDELGSYDFIHNVYGSPACAMNGGHAGRMIKQEDYLNEIDEWNRRGISVWLTFSNYLATITDLENDDQSVCLLDKINNNNKIFNVKNGVILANNDHVAYIKHKYKQLITISSVVMHARNGWEYSKELYDNLLNVYDKVCISYHHNDHVDDFIGDFINREQDVEVLINNICNLNCKVIRNCYQWQSKKSLGLETGVDSVIGPMCPSTQYRNKNKLTPPSESTVLSFEDTKKLANAGFILKLASRVYNINAFKAMIYGWMIKINYRDIIENVLYGLEDKELYPDEK